jgi:hypothetical protein
VSWLIRVLSKFELFLLGLLEFLVLLVEVSRFELSLFVTAQITFANYAYWSIWEKCVY